MNSEKKILVAEDRTIDAAYLKLMLEREGWQVDVAQEGYQVLDNALTEIYTLLIVNAHFHGSEGMEVVREIRGKETSTGRHIPILGITSYSLSEEKRRCLSAGMDYCLAKPIYQKNITDILSKLMA
jgi:two-component system, sensor histidine kinase and response regulator